MAVPSKLDDGDKEKGYTAIWDRKFSVVTEIDAQISLKKIELN